MISVVIPVYNSAAVVGETIDRVVQTCEREGWQYEVIAVDDRSTDGSAAVLHERTTIHARLRVIGLPTNGGQHAALLAGLRAAGGDYVACMDDDLQHPPEALASLVGKAREGHDAVYARFDAPRHASWRRPGSAAVRWLDRFVFGAPRDLTVTSFRVLRRDVVDLVCAYEGPAPYIRGQVLLASGSPATVPVAHAPRPRGPSSYTPLALLAFVARVVLEWSRLPGHLALAMGAILVVGAAGLQTVWPAAGSFAALPLMQGLALCAAGLAWLWRRRRQERGTVRLQPRGDLTKARRLGIQQREAGVVGGPERLEAQTTRLERGAQAPDATGPEEGAQAGDAIAHREGDTDQRGKAPTQVRPS